MQQYLSYRNKNYILDHVAVVPKEFTAQITLEDHQKAAKYTTAKSKVAMFSRVFDLALIIFWLPLGGAGFVNQYLYRFELSSIKQGIVFFSILGIISTITSLPFTLYNTFILEEKFGFNKTTPKTFALDMLKQLLLSVIIALPFLYVILYIMEGLGTFWWIYAWAFIITFQFILMWAYPKFLAPLFNKFTPLDQEDFNLVVSKLCSKVGFEHKGVFVMDASKRSSHGNAYFTGFGKNKRIVFFDTLIKSLLPIELEAILAHELGHFKKKHIFKMLIINTLMMLVGFAVLGFLYQQYDFYTTFKFIKPAAHSALYIFTSIIPIYTFFLTPVFSFFSRKNEYEADEFAATHSSAEHLVTALLKLYKNNSSTLTPDPLFSKFYNSHPTALERINFLNSLK
ncbi:M48 family metallopeptidase [Bacteriovoracaceae bacterium]|nr:M48 family metallopeptidase [Bacteriovoracaceae bacterium]